MLSRNGRGFLEQIELPEAAPAATTRKQVVNVRALGRGDYGAVAAIQCLFDGPSDAAATARFLADPNHHLLVAYEADDRPVGFVSGVEMTHPDKGTEMFLYELAVAGPARRRGTGRALVEALATRARARLLRHVRLYGRR